MVFGYRKGNFEDCDWGKKAKQSVLYIFPKPIHKTWVRKDTGRISEVNLSHMSMTLLGHSQQPVGL